MSEGPYDYAAEIYDAEWHDRPLRRETWNGTSWSERPDPSEYADLRSDRG